MWFSALAGRKIAIFDVLDPYSPTLINSVAKGGLTTIFDVEEKISQICKIHFGAFTGAPGN